MKQILKDYKQKEKSFGQERKDHSCRSDSHQCNTVLAAFFFE